MFSENKIGDPGANFLTEAFPEHIVNLDLNLSYYYFYL